MWLWRIVSGLLFGAGSYLICAAVYFSEQSGPGDDQVPPLLAGLGGISLFLLAIHALRLAKRAADLRLRMEPPKVLNFTGQGQAWDWNGQYTLPSNPEVSPEVVAAGWSRFTFSVACATPLTPHNSSTRRRRGRPPDK